MSQKHSIHARRLNLETLYNVRDLGGFATKDKQVTAFGRFLRGDAPVRLSDHDRELLLAYPVRTVIDLRSPSEMKDRPHSLRGQAGIDYYNIPILGFDMMASIIEMGGGEDKPFISMPDLYISILEKARDPIGEVMSHLAQANSGTCFFHCTHGKDRTGLIAALLLLLAEGYDMDIVASYQISATLLSPWFNTFIETVPEDAKHFFRTDPESMVHTLKYFHQHLGPATDYLASCKVSPKDIRQLRHRLLA